MEGDGQVDGLEVCQGWKMAVQCSCQSGRVWRARLWCHWVD